MESNSVCNHTSVVYHEYDLQTELDDTKSYYQLIIKITISEKKKNSEVMKKGEIRFKILTKEA